MEDNIQSLRISDGLGLSISYGKGEFKPNHAQIESLRNFLVKNNSLESEVITEDFVGTAKKLVQKLRNEILL